MTRKRRGRLSKKRRRRSRRAPVWAQGMRNTSAHRLKNFQNGGGRRVIIFQFETRDDKYLNALMKSVQEYARGRGYEYIRPTQNTMSPYWMKVKLVLEKLKEIGTDGNTILAWIDSDSYIVPNRMGIDELVAQNGSKAFLGSKEIPEWQAGSNSFNSGNFFVVNKPIAKQMFTEWFALYNPADWKLDREKNTYTTDKPYAQGAYEQGSFQNNIIPNSAYAAEIKLLEPDVLNNYRRECDKNPDTVVCQFINSPPGNGGNGKDNIAPFACAHGLLPCDIL